MASWGRGIQLTAAGAVLALSCSGSVSESPRPDGGAGTIGGGGASGDGGSSGGGSGGSLAGSAGSAAPVECREGAPCSGQGCREPRCCGRYYGCSNGRLELLGTPDCRTPSCPNWPPWYGSPCDPCTDVTAETCSYDACINEGVRYHARCGADHTWQVEAVECPPRPSCGTDAGAATCNRDEVCVYEDGPNSAPVCRKNPCTSGPLLCSCASALCDPFPVQCTLTPDSSVVCTCVDC
jgi:hypothetical protein